MAKEITCVVEGCTFHAEAPSEPELLAKVAKHAAAAHGVDDISPDLLKRVRGAIREVPAKK